MWQKIKNIYHLYIAVLSNLIFWFPARKLIVIGVTGTDGKTTTVNLIYHILRSSKIRVSMISSISAVIDDKAYDTGFHVTTPSSFALQKFIRKAVNTKSKYFVLEVTSHSIDQNRIWGIPFKIGVVTNVTSEHLDYHKTYDNYLKTKEKLVKISKTAIINKDDSSYNPLREAVTNKKQENWISYGLSGDSDINPEIYPIKDIKFMGEFNNYNVLAAVAVCKSLGLQDDKIIGALKTFEMPVGRIDFVYDKEFQVMIDFAHTANAFQKVLSSIKPLAKGKIIHVFGSAGERDKFKRPLLGEISSNFSDIIILTSEDPRSEDVNKIIEEIESGIKGEKVEVFKIPDRREAISAAIQMADKNDFVIITGKAQEKSMNYGSGEEPWNEYEVVKDAIGLKNKK
jgi:UDP-N-acetylmuramoyl-L-alanyl-D-glutamate--2,6-diaminopimelate ligase